VPLPSNFRSDYPKEGINLTVGYNSSDPLFTPRSGISAALSTTFSGLDWLRSDEYRFNRLLFDLRGYTILTEDFVMAARFKAGSIRSFDSPEFIPFEERFYAGGSVSVRGWGRSLLGPLDPRGNPIGGSSLLETGIEFRVPEGSTISWVAFLDAGNVWETPLTYKIDDLQYAGGVGLRYATPIGPLRLDIAHPIGHGSQQVQWWFSIGHAF
jgi:outer membrane protein insertion porin family